MVERDNWAGKYETSGALVPADNLPADPAETIRKSPAMTGQRVQRRFQHLPHLSRPSANHSAGFPIGPKNLGTNPVASSPKTTRHCVPIGKNLAVGNTTVTGFSPSSKR